MQLKFDFAFWTHRAVRALIKHEFKADISLLTAGFYLRSWRMSLQRLTHRTIEEDEKRVRRWKLEKYSSIIKRVKVENAVIYW